LGDCIYKIPEVLDRENWVIFLNIMNNSSETLNLENIQFNTYSNSKLISDETNYRLTEVLGNMPGNLYEFQNKT
jgi:hypothetical protein